jgi:NADH dehydrogenase
MCRQSAPMRNHRRCTDAPRPPVKRPCFPEATIVRPSVLFGPEDNFFNLFAGLSRLSWVMPVFGCPLEPEFKLFPKDGFIDIDLYGDGGTKLQPVFAGDVAGAIMTMLDDAKTSGVVYELGGPTVYSFKETMDLLLETTGRKRFLAPIPFGLAKFAAWFLEFWPKPILTRDQVDLLRRDNVVSGDQPGFDDLAIKPVAAEAVLPTYLHRFRVPARQTLSQT